MVSEDKITCSELFESVRFIPLVPRWPTVLICSCAMSDQTAMEPWIHSKWALHHLEELRDLYATSMYDGEAHLTFDDCIGELHSILVPVNAWPTHPDIQRGLGVAKYLKEFLRRSQKPAHSIYIDHPPNAGSQQRLQNVSDRGRPTK